MYPKGCGSTSTFFLECSSKSSNPIPTAFSLFRSETASFMVYLLLLSRLLREISLPDKFPKTILVRTLQKSILSTDNTTVIFWNCKSAASVSTSLFQTRNYYKGISWSGLSSPFHSHLTLMLQTSPFLCPWRNLRRFQVMTPLAPLLPVLFPLHSSLLFIPPVLSPRSLQRSCISSNTLTPYQVRCGAPALCVLAALTHRSPSTVTPVISSALSWGSSVSPIFHSAQHTQF